MVRKPPEVKTLSRRTKGKQVARDKEATDGNQATNLVYDSLTGLPLDLVIVKPTRSYSLDLVAGLTTTLLQKLAGIPGIGGWGVVPESSLSLSKPTSKEFQYTTLFRNHGLERN
ncbi:hypothetical protein BB8028_0006g10390 [Beauveria bassiana]|uniref:Uncharacterized protein n=1 Tax=Beauveria bassiana TaxID=176275 RepID=A0A2S7YKK3_BEABA|nr:hypothetical protein BB8028_0006g10390 [Beauveria bassiana]